MSSYIEYPFSRLEQLQGKYFIATYLIFGINGDNALDKIKNFAVGQTIGTWVKLPGITDEMVEKYQARVLSIDEVPGEEESTFIARIAFPSINFANSFTMMLTSLVGNDVSTSLKTKLIGIEATNSALEDYQRSNDSINKLRSITGVKKGPMILNMIKPCMGFSPEEGAKLFYQVALGGVDLIKDDELLGNPTYNQISERVRLYNIASQQAYEKTGKKTVYMVNVTDSPSKMIENTKIAIDAGAKACLVNFAFTGLDALKELCDLFSDKLFIMAHYAGVGIMNWEKGGIANPVYLGTLPRLTGVDSMMTMFPNMKDGKEKFDFYKTVQAQNLAMGPIKPIVTAVGGGITPLHIESIVGDLGEDIIIGIGGAIQGHPQGATAGAKAVMSAMNAAIKGESLESAAENCKELNIAIQLWKGGH